MENDDLQGGAGTAYRVKDEVGGMMVGIKTGGLVEVEIMLGRQKVPVTQSPLIIVVADILQIWSRELAGTE